MEDAPVDSVEASMHPEDYSMEHFPLGSSDLPFDILLRITTYIPAEDLLTLSQVNRYLNELLSDGSFWHLRASSYYPKDLFPLIDDDERTTLQTLQIRCVKNERFRHAFREEAVHMQSKWFPVAERGHRCNALTFMDNGNVLVTGGNDHRVTLWNLRDIKDDSYSPELGLGDVGTVAHRHGDWVTSLCVWKNSLSSGSMDRSIRLYDVQGAQTLPITSLGTGRGVLCHDRDGPNTVVAGMHNSVELFDARVSTFPVMYKFLSQADSFSLVWDIALVGHEAIIITSDSIRVMDTRMQRFVFSKEFPDGEQGYRISADGRNCWVGTNSGSVFLYDTQSFEIVSDFSEVFGFTQCRVVGLHCDESHVLACSADGSAKMMEPTKDPKVLWEWKNESELDLRTLAFGSDCSIAISSADRAHIWWPA
ncbi:hypothetical protein RvY_17683 [Ramazzottius varieornatus]|uniref:F-box domain-containing protein n=1 Tax=Ramazzottius varieornatus TaxID=947166 RepID=A0A1D1W538_RAMVA|nr:hypothetical protein RvY_17683 [Ramazzottius varieornatus]